MADGSARGTPAGRAVARRATLWAAVTVVVAALGGALLPLAAPPLARAQTVARVVAQPEPGAAVASARDDAVTTVLGLARTPAVHDGVAVRTGATTAAVRDGLAVTPVPGAAGFVEVRADAPSAAAAQRVASAAVVVLAAELERADAERLRATLGPLDGQLQALAAQLRLLPPLDPARGLLAQRYGALAAEVAARTAAPAPRLLPGGIPTVGTGPRPSPAVTAALAGLVALVVAVPAAALAARRARRRPGGPDPVDELAAVVPGMRTVLTYSDDAPAVLTRFWVGVVRGRGPVLVLQLGARDRLDLGGLLVAAGRLVGDEVVLRDLAAPAAAPGPPPRTGRALTVSTLRTPGVDGATLAAARRAAPAVVLAVDTVGVGRAEVAGAVAAMGVLEREVRGIVVWRGRLPRDPALEQPALAPAQDDPAGG